MNSDPAPTTTLGIDLDKLMTVEEFAGFLGVTRRWVLEHLDDMPGVIKESGRMVRIHPRTYLNRRLKGFAK